MADPVRYDDFTDESRGFPDKLIRVFADVNLRLHTLEAIGSDLREIEQRYGTAALERIDAVLTPAVANIQLVLDDAAEQLADLASGAPNSSQLGGELPEFYTDLANSTGVLPPERGGTGGTTPGEAITNLGITPAAIGTLTAAQITTAIADGLDGVVNGAPGTLDTLNELADAIGNDPNFAASLVPSSRSISAGSGLTGGGTLSANRTLSLLVATVAQFRAAQTGTYALTAKNVWDGAAEVPLGSTGNVTPNFSTFINGFIGLTANRVLNNPSNVKPGQTGWIRVKQNATGGLTLSYGSTYKFIGGEVPILSTDPNAEDVFFYVCLSTTRILLIPAYKVDL